MQKNLDNLLKISIFGVKIITKKSPPQRGKFRRLLKNKIYE